MSDANPRRFTKQSRGDASDIDGQLVRASERARTSQTPYTFSAMSVIGIGVDVIECSRIQHSIERFGERFLHRVFTDGEIEYSMSMKFPERHLAARFAGKEAVAKAFGTGIGKAMGWRNIDIRKKESGEPFLIFSGPAEIFAAERGVASALITLSHTENYAVACAVLQGEEVKRVVPTR